jgi:hypothetical protein
LNSNTNYYKISNNIFHPAFVCIIIILVFNTIVTQYGIVSFAQLSDNSDANTSYKGNINSLSRNLMNNTSLILTAGKIQDMKFNIANNNDFQITNAVASIASESSDLKIVGDSLWSIPSLGAHSRHEFSTRVYASTALIGAPVSFLVTLQYISGAQSKIGSFILGGNVVGDIRVSVTDLSVNYVAGTPNLVGNLLNQGNTIGLFSTVQLINQPFSSPSLSSEAPAALAGNGSSSSSPHQGQQQQQQHHRNQVTNGVTQSTLSQYPPQYLGDLQPDSPLPFSIPLLNVDNSTIRGSHPVSLKITYSDDLKNSHQITINSSLQVNPQQPHTRGAHRSENSVFGIPFPVLLIAIVAIIALIVIRIIRRRQKSRIEEQEDLVISESGEQGNMNSDSGNNNDEDIETLLDDSHEHEQEKKTKS